jgi:hypothetical protein
MSPKSEKVGRIDVDTLAEAFDLPTWDDTDERNADYYAEQADHYANDPDDEESRFAAETEAANEVFARWYDAVMAAVEHEFGEHGLTLVPCQVKRRKSVERPWEYRIVPTESWRDAAGRIMDTINGVGSFEFRTVKEFLDSGPYTAREAVLKHLHWLHRRSDVYGDVSPRRRFDAAWRD